MIREPIGRAELKYYFPTSLVKQIRAYLLKHTKYDPYASIMPDSTYTVRSIYFDTDQLDFFYEKQDGLAIRKKLRVRAYNEFALDQPAFLEIKRRHFNRVIKERALIQVDQIDMVHNKFKAPDLGNSDDILARNTIKKYRSNLENLGLRSTALIVYDREAFVGLIDPGERATIDKNVRSSLYPELGSLFSGQGLLPVTSDYILELKFDRCMPKWMAQMVKLFKLRCEAIPKYCMGVETCVQSNSMELPVAQRMVSI